MSVDTKHVSGMWAEYVAAAYFTSQGYTVSWPSLSQSRYDMLVDTGEDLWRVQVKKASWNKSGNYLYLQARLGGDTRAQGRGRLSYTKQDCDKLFFVSDECDMWMFPVESLSGTSNVCLKTTCPKPNKRTKSYDVETHYIAGGLKLQ